MDLVSSIVAELGCYIVGSVGLILRLFLLLRAYPLGLPVSV